MIHTIKKYNLPTAYSRQGAARGGFDYFFGYELGVEYQVVVNWFSGDISLFGDISGGVYGGTPRGFFVDGSENYSAIWNASGPDVIAGPYSYISGEAGLDYFAKATANGTLSVAVEYEDVNENGAFDQEETIYILSPVMDPVFLAPIISGSGGFKIGGNAIPNGIEGGVHAGTGASARLLNFNIYDLLPYAAVPPWHEVKRHD